MALIKISTVRNRSVNHVTGITYVYETETFRDTETNERIRKRHVVGKIDAETGEIIPTGKKSLSADDTESLEKYKKLYENSIANAEKQSEFEKSIRKELLDALNEADERLAQCASQISKERKWIASIIKKYSFQ